MVDANLHMTLIVSTIETDKLQMMHTGYTPQGRDDCFLYKTGTIGDGS